MEFINAAWPDLSGVLNKHLTGCLNWRQSPIKGVFGPAVCAGLSPNSSSNAAHCLKALYSEVVPRRICRGRSRELIARVSCDCLAGLRKEQEINTAVGGVAGMLSGTESCRDETSGDMAAPGCPKVPLSGGAGAAGTTRPFLEPGPGYKARWRKRKRSGFPSACDSPRAGPAGPGQEKDGLL